MKPSSLTDQSVDTAALAPAESATAPAAAELATATAADTAAAPTAEAGADVASEAAGGSAAAAAPSARSLLKVFQQQFPAFRDCLPLAIGIDKQILAQMPGLDRKTMRAALGIHTGSLRYLRAMEKAKLRHDLDGSSGAEVSDTHRNHAAQVLQERFKKEAERKKAERNAGQAARKLEQAAAHALEADRLRQEKLQLLASKFSRNGG